MREEFQHKSSSIKIKAGTTDIFGGPLRWGRAMAGERRISLLSGRWYLTLTFPVEEKSPNLDS